MGRVWFVSITACVIHIRPPSLERDAMGCDEYSPLTKKGTNLTDSGGIGYTVIDALDTMQLMNLQEEYERARKWIATKLTFDRDGNYNTFEVNVSQFLFFFSNLRYHSRQQSASLVASFQHTTCPPTNSSSPKLPT